MNDRWRKATPAEALEALLARHREQFSPAEVREVEQAILALREADQRGAAATCTEGASPETGESQNRASDGKLEAQSAPPHPGGQEKAAPTALASSDPEGHLQAMSDAELPAPVSPGPDHETLIVERLRSIHAELLAAAEEENSRAT